jgi:hypothetical protein
MDTVFISYMYIYIYNVHPQVKVDLFINAINYNCIYIHHIPSYSYWSYVHQLRYWKTGEPHCICNSSP